MEFELHPAISLKPGTFNILIAPEKLFADALNNHLHLQRYGILYIGGNYSRILSRLHRKFTELEVRRAFTAFQLLTILDEASHTLVFIEHDRALYEDVEDLLEYLSHAMKEAAKETIVLLYSPESDPFLEQMADMADRVFYFDNFGIDEGRSARSRSRARPESQTTLEVF
jgi:hypothetical protein